MRCNARRARRCSSRVVEVALCTVSHLLLACGNVSDDVSLVVGMLVPADVLRDGQDLAEQVRV